MKYKIDEVLGNPSPEMQSTGIYILTERVKGKFYIGSTRTCFRTRWNQHILELRRNVHHCSNLQRAFNKYGEDSFTFSILEFIYVPLQMFDVEQMYLDVADKKLLYNSFLVAGSPLGFKPTLTTRARQSAARKNRIYPAETLQNFSKAQRQANIRLDNTSGIKGVHWSTKEQKWVAQIHVNKKRYHLGRFDTLEQAIKIRESAEIRYWSNDVDPEMDKSLRPHENTSGCTGVTQLKKSKRWLCQIMINKKSKNVGAFSTVEEAIKARRDAEIKYFGKPTQKATISVDRLIKTG